MLFALLFAVSDVEISQPQGVAMPISQPSGGRGARTLVSGFALSIKGTAMLPQTPMGSVGGDVTFMMALTSELDLFAGSRLALADKNGTVVPYVGARWGHSFNGRTFLGIELAVSSAFPFANLQSVTWFIEPALLATFTPLRWLELTAGLHALSAPQLDLWAVGPGLQAAFRVAERVSLLAEMKTLLLRDRTGYHPSPSVALGVAFH